MWGGERLEDDWPVLWYYVALVVPPALIVLAAASQRCDAVACVVDNPISVAAPVIATFLVPVVLAVGLHRLRPLGGRIGRRLPPDHRGRVVGIVAALAVPLALGALLLQFRDPRPSVAEMVLRALLVLPIAVANLIVQLPLPRPGPVLDTILFIMLVASFVCSGLWLLVVGFAGERVAHRLIGFVDDEHIARVSSLVTWLVDGVPRLIDWLRRRRPSGQDWPALWYTVMLGMPATTFVSIGVAPTVDCYDVPCRLLLGGLWFGVLATAIVLGLAIHRYRPLEGAVGQVLPQAPRGRTLGVALILMTVAAIVVVLTSVDGLRPSRLYLATEHSWPYVAPALVLIFPLVVLDVLHTVTDHGHLFTISALVLVELLGLWLVGLVWSADIVWQRLGNVVGSTLRAAGVSSVVLLVLLVAMAGLHVDVPFGRTVGTDQVRVLGLTDPPENISSDAVLPATLRYAERDLHNYAAQGPAGYRPGIRLTELSVDCLDGDVALRPGGEVYVVVACRMNTTVVSVPWRKQTVHAEYPITGTYIVNETDILRKDWGFDYNPAVPRRPDLDDADLRHARLAGVNLHEHDLTGARLVWADLRGANLSFAQLAGANLSRATLAGANLYGATLSNAASQRADLSGADLRYVSADRANLSGANLSRARLTGARLRETDLRDADLRSADLRDADLWGARLNGSRWREARLDGAQLPKNVSR